jgi:ribonuclease HI
LLYLLFETFLLFHPHDVSVLRGKHNAYPVFVLKKGDHMTDQIVITVDGGCKDHGTSLARCYGSFAVHHNGELKRIRERFALRDCHTAPEAEYAALVEALVYLKALEINCPRVGQIPVTIQMDAALVVNQVNGVWKLDAANLFELNQRARNTLTSLRGRYRSLALVKIDNAKVKDILGH